MRLASRIDRLNAKTDAAIRVNTAQARLAHQADVNDLKVRRQRLELVQLEEQAKTARAAAAAERQAMERARIEAEKAARRASRKAWRDRWVAALSDRSVLALVALAVITAWVGQATAFQQDLGMTWPIAAAGATALELTGIVLLRKLGEASALGARALRMRLVIWGVIAFAAWANLSHYGVVMAAMSVLGPTVWEVTKWWERQRRLHAAGDLRPRPVRPRFPVDHWAFYPRDTWTAYRVAVRDEIGDPRIALAVARGERARRDLAAELGAWHTNMARAIAGLVAHLEPAPAPLQRVVLDRATASPGLAPGTDRAALPARALADAGDPSAHNAKTDPARRPKRPRRRANRTEVTRQARAALAEALPESLDGPWVRSVVKGPLSNATAARVAADLRAELTEEQAGPHLVKSERTA
jgi:hypothetical protein